MMPYNLCINHGRLIVAAMAGTFCFAATGAIARDISTLPELAIAGPESMLVKSLHEISDRRIDSALNGIEHLLKTNPNFRLAHLIRGDLLLARSRKALAKASPE